MSLAANISLAASGVFLLVGILLGVVKYRDLIALSLAPRPGLR